MLTVGLRVWFPASEHGSVLPALTAVGAGVFSHTSSGFPSMAGFVCVFSLYM